MVEGYNIKLKLGNKTLIAVTQDDLSISATTKDSITKDDAGVKQTSVTGHEVTFTVAGLVELDSTSGTTKMDSDALLEQAMKTGSNAPVAFTFQRGSGKTVSGNCIMTSYSESAPADPDSDSTYSASFKTTGSVTVSA